jgi:hypothetical protein
MELMRRRLPRPNGVLREATQRLINYKTGKNSYDHLGNCGPGLVGSRPSECLWQAAALGNMPLVEQFLAGEPTPTVYRLSEAFWHACHGGQRRVAEYLLARGADTNGKGFGWGTPLDVAGAIDVRRESLVEWLRQHGAQPEPSHSDDRTFGGPLTGDQAGPSTKALQVAAIQVSTRSSDQP